MSDLWNRTWHRLRDWTNGQAPSESLAAQILLAEGFTGLDPIHPYGGPDGNKDALCQRGDEQWIMAVHFPRGKISFTKLQKKFLSDLKGVPLNDAIGMAFVTNQELSEGQRNRLRNAALASKVEIFHLDRVTSILDQPKMVDVRKQFLGADFDQAVLQQVQDLKTELARTQSFQTGGDTYCYWMLYHFDMQKSIAQQYAVIRKGEFPLYDLRARIVDMDAPTRDVFNDNLGELNAPAVFRFVQWALKHEVYYRAFFHARNGAWHQDLILKRSEKHECWLAATNVKDRMNREVAFTYLDNGFVQEFGEPAWRS